MEKASEAILRYCLVITCFTSPSSVLYAQQADIDLLRSVNLHRNRSLDKSMEHLTNSVYPVSGIAPIAELIIGYSQHNKQLIGDGWTTGAGLCTNFVVTFGLKYSVNRTRPYIIYPDLQPYKRNNDASFPSGHTSFAFNTATSLAIMCPRWYVVVPAYGWATAVGYSRMHLGMHYPTDVIAGAIVGAGTAILAAKGNKWLQHRKQKKATVEH